MDASIVLFTPSNIMHIPNTRVSEVAEQYFAIRLSKFRMVDPIEEKFEISLNCSQNWYTGVLEVADHDFAIRLPKFKMKDPIWRLKIRKKLTLC